MRAERIDQGVDYAGTGSLGAIGAGVVTQVVQTGSGWESGGYVEYKLTSGPYAGRYIYYAEGQSSYANVYGGGYREGGLTAAGQAFSQLIASLGGPAGLTEGRSVTGHFP